MKKKIKIKGRCPICGRKMVYGSWMYDNEPNTEQFLPICENEDCDLAYGYGSNIKYRWINHRTVKIEGLYE